MALPFETARLIMRPFHIEDAAAFSAYRSDPSIARFQGWKAPFSLARAEIFITEMIARECAQPGQWYQIALERKADGQMIGDCATCLSEDSRQAEIAFTLASAFQGQGFAAEAVERLLQYLFCDLKVHRTFANVDPDNQASIRLLTRLGFRCEGRFHQSLWLNGSWVDEQWYALLRKEWQDRQRDARGTQDYL